MRIPTVYRRLWLALLLAGAALAFPLAALAHPLGNFTVNHYAGLEVTPEVITVDYVLDMAEIPAYQEIAALDTDGDGQPASAEAAAYHPGKCQALAADLTLALEGQSIPLALQTSSVEFPAGAGGLLTLRLTCQFFADLAVAGDSARIAFQDNTYADRLGWREIVVTPEGVSLEGEFSTHSLSQRLTSYPDDLLNRPPEWREVEFALTPGPSPVPMARETDAAVGAIREDGFTRLVSLEDLSPPALLLAFVTAFVWGGLHALTPGHGKTVVGAYLVGSRGTARHALLLGLTTTVTHTAGVFALGLLTLFASQFILPERLFPWLSLLSGLLVVLIGGNLLLQRFRAGRAFAHAHHDAPHHEGQDHPRGYEHSGDHEHGHSHSLTSSHSHSHLPPGADGNPVTARGLIALGVSGGLLPCPSALVVMLGAIALGRVGFGMALVVAFSLGLAGVLTGIGLVLVYAGRLFHRLPARSRVGQWVPAGSALFITLAGLAITFRALAQVGLVSLAF